MLQNPLFLLLPVCGGRVHPEIILLAIVNPVNPDISKEYCSRGIDKEWASSRV